MLLGLKDMLEQGQERRGGNGIRKGHANKCEELLEGACYRENCELFQRNAEVRQEIMCIFEHQFIKVLLPDILVMLTYYLQTTT